MLLLPFLLFKIIKRMGSCPVLTHFKMKMVSGAFPGRTDISDYLPLFDFLPVYNGNAGTMGVKGSVAACVLYFNMEAVPAPQLSVPFAVTTVPSAAAIIKVSAGAPISIPPWYFVVPSMGSFRYP